MPKLATILVTLSAALAVAGPAAATPVTRVVAPNGSGIDCSMPNPCSYAYALNSFGSNAGDIVLALPGTYDVSSMPVDITHQLTVMGDPAQPRPVFTTSNPVQDTFTVAPTANGTVLRHLDLRAIGAYEALRGEGRIDAADMAISTTVRCVQLYGDGSVLADSTLTGVPAAGKVPLCVDTEADSTLRNLTIDAPTGAGVLLGSGKATFEDSTVTATNPVRLNLGGENHVIHRVSLFGSASGIFAEQHGSATVTDSVIATVGGSTAARANWTAQLHLRNDTIIASGASAVGIKAFEAASTYPPGKIDARNLIVHADGPDLVSGVASNPAGCTPAPCAPGALSIDHSAFDDIAGPVVGSSGLTADPLFVDAAGGNFHLAPGSPAIDAGAADLQTEATDRDGHLRFQGPGLDLGAYESTPVPPAPGGGPAGTDPAAAGAPTGSSPGAQPPAADLTAPVLSALRVTNRVFAIGRGATAVSARKRGTTFRYKLSEPAAVKIDIARRATRTRYAHVITLSRKGHLGANATKLSGRIKRRALKAGPYRATFTARDAAGNRSKRVVVKFTVVR